MRKVITIKDCMIILLLTSLLMIAYNSMTLRIDGEKIEIKEIGDIGSNSIALSLNGDTYLNYKGKDFIIKKDKTIVKSEKNLDLRAINIDDIVSLKDLYLSSNENVINYLKINSLVALTISTLLLVFALSINLNDKNTISIHKVLKEFILIAFVALSINQLQNGKVKLKSNYIANENVYFRLKDEKLSLDDETKLRISDKYMPIIENKDENVELGIQYNYLIVDKDYEPYKSMKYSLNDENYLIISLVNSVYIIAIALMAYNICDLNKKN